MIVFCLLQLDGTIVAPTNSKIWSSGLLWWIEFTKLKGITIQGSGTIEGRGSVWWSQTEPDDEHVSLKHQIIAVWFSIDSSLNSIQQNSHQFLLQISEELGTKMPSIKPTVSNGNPNSFFSFIFHQEHDLKTIFFRHYGFTAVTM